MTTGFDDYLGLARGLGALALLGRAAGSLGQSDDSDGGNPPDDPDPLTDTLCQSGGVCATIGVRNQNRSVSCLNLLCSKIRVRLTGDVVNLGEQPVNSATLRLELYDGQGNTVRTLQESIGALQPGERVELNRTVEGLTTELQKVQNGGARLIIEEWS